MADQKLGMFIGCFQIGGAMPGQPVVTLQLGFNAPNKTVNGQAHIGWAVNPPVSESSYVYGDYTYMTVMPNNTHILVVLTGYPVPHAPGQVGPAIDPNLTVRMVLESDWQSGQANITFRDANGVMHEANGLPVKAIPCGAPPV